MINLSKDSNFQEEVLDSEVPVLVVFSALWCGPCKVYKETIKEVFKELKELNKDTALKMVTVDVDDCPEVSSTYNIKSIPATVIFSNKVVKEELNGAISKTTLLQLINKYI